ncbi:SWI/SNF-related matrix-associated actin-dependent regulator 1 of chromatin subfamily A [Dysgonomonas hofstadii]|uniref:SWI/SNF-related matrix-associated actin-dependent regulator 1 of chromatin subfamily A n=1 Tax=Dysgonomonas hofstadii TaxID=637886 RepID=A0A840CMH7_9BACT|nr:DEAD/DEAH box helicase [Dysgonomonas hofstadii]MBB4036596.1 SWI/SNF-related matrix-associated actin-dependent regulator 1 of chromatin subfamily A [Dysgonomonas hofstadii]
MVNIVLKTGNLGSYYEIYFDYHPKLVRKLQDIKTRTDARYLGKYWTISAAYQLEIEKFARYAKFITDVIMGEPPKNVYVDYTPVELEKLIIPHQLKVNPYPYQGDGIATGLKFKRFLNGDDPGLGKTLQSIGTVNLADAFPCLVICPSAIKINWQREWHKFTDKKAMILDDKVVDTWPFFWEAGMNQVFIVNYESLKKFFVQKLLKPKGWMLADVVFRDIIKLFKSVIVDESHKCKDFSAQQSKLTMGIANGKEMVICLSGTPVVNKPKDLAPQLGIMGQLQNFGGYQNFIKRYCSGPNKASNLRELNQILRQNCFFRREKKEVLKDLPDKVRQVLTCEITNRREYMDAEKNLIEYLRKYKDADDAKIAKSMRGEVMVRIQILRNVSARGKIKDVIEFVEDFIQSGQKMVLFIHLREVAEALMKYFPEAVTIRGGDTAEDKQRSIDSFQSNPDIPIIICSIKAAGVGVDGLQKVCQNVAFVEFPWTYADCIQCEDRLHRIGQKGSVMVYYFLGQNTIDEKVYKIIQEKKNIANAVTGSVDTVETNMIDMVANIFNV